MNIVTVRINGVEYNLKGEEREEYLHKVAAYVDRKIKNISSNNGKLSTTSAAVLTAVNTVDELFKCDEAYSKMSERMVALENSEKELKEQVQLLKKQLVQLENYNKELAIKLENGGNEDVIIRKDEDISRLSSELELMQETAKKYSVENEAVKSEIKELKFQLQSSKYKIIDLQNRLINNQIDLAKVKKSNNPLLRTEK